MRCVGLEEVGRLWGRSALTKFVFVKIFFKAVAAWAANISKLEYCFPELDRYVFKSSTV